MALIDKDMLRQQLGGNQIPTEDDSLLTDLAAGVWSLWEQLTGRIWEKVSGITEYHSCQEDYETRLYLKQYPVTTITSIHDDVNWSYGTSTLLAATNYAYDAASGIVQLKPGYYFYKGDRNVKVVYDAGYLAAGFPPGIKQVLLRQAAHWYRQTKNFQDTEKLDSLLDEFKALVEVKRRRNA